MEYEDISGNHACVLRGRLIRQISSYAERGAVEMGWLFVDACWMVGSE